MAAGRLGAGDEMPIKPSIAVIDGDQAYREALVGQLRSCDLIAKTFPDAEEFLASARLSLTTCLIAELRLGGMSGLELYGQLLARGTPIPTILMTAGPDQQTRVRALGAGVTALLNKPVNESELLDCINRTMGRNAPHRRGKQSPAIR